MTCRLEQIYLHQNKLMNQFEKIEYENNLLETPEIPVDMESAAGQARLRNFAGRITEEIVEVLNEYTGEGHLKELADVMHFYVELLLLAGMQPGDVQPDPLDRDLDRLDELMPTVTLHGLTSVVALHDNLNQNIRLLWTATNALKQKAWKAGRRESDLVFYKIMLRMAYRHFLGTVANYGISSQEFFEAYMGKAAENQQRINDGI